MAISASQEIRNILKNKPNPGTCSIEDVKPHLKNKNISNTLFYQIRREFIKNPKKGTQKSKRKTTNTSRTTRVGNDNLSAESIKHVIIVQEMLTKVPADKAKQIIDVLKNNN